MNHSEVYRLLVRNLPGGLVVLVDDKLHIVAAEGGDLRLLNTSDSIPDGKSLIEVISPDNPEPLEACCRGAMSGQPQHFEIETAGRVYETWAVPLQDPAAPGASLLLSLHDISEFKRGGRAMRRADRAYQTLGAASRALLRAETEEELLNLVCQALVEIGGYLMAWIGFAERDVERWLRPVAWAGREEGYLTSRRLTWADSDLGQRPGPMSIRTGLPAIAQHIATDPSFALWREDALRLGFSSALAVPLLDEYHSAFGCLEFYSDEPGAFDSREAQILIDMAGGLAYGIRALRNTQMRLAMVTALQESEARFRMLTEGAIVGVYIIQDNHFSYVNPACTRMFGYSRREFLDEISVSDVVHPDDRGLVAENLRKRIQGEVDAIQYEFRGIRKDGSVMNLEVRGSRAEYQGRPAVIGMLFDITDRIRVEKAEREQRLLSETLAETAGLLINVLDTAAVLKRVVEGVRRVIDFDLIVLMSGRDRIIHEVLVQTPQTSATSAVVQPVKIRVGEVPLLNQMAQTCQMVVAPDTDVDTAWVPFQSATTAHSFAGAPICFEKSILGFVGVFSATRGAFSEAHGRILQAFANQAAMALRNVDLYRELTTYSEFLEDAVESATADVRRAKEQVEAIVLNDPNAVLLLASDGTIKLSNPAFEHLFGYEAWELRGEPPGMLVAPRDAPTLDGAIQALMAQPVTMHLDLHAMRKNGSELDIQMALAPIEDGERLIGIVCDIHDVTTFKEGERLKDAFVSNVSHELRTPLTSLRLNTALMRRNPEKQDVYLDRQMRDLDRLSQLIENLLLLSRLDQKRGELIFRPLDLGSWAASLIDDYAMLASGRSLTLTLQPEPGLPPVNADSGFLSQVLGNLLNNAINYTPPGGNIRVATLKRRAANRTWAGFSVTDTGPGISPEEQERLFERFYRGRAGRSARTPGSGLGLSIARDIVVLHNGEIEMESSGRPGEGAVFRVWLPAVKNKRG